MDLKEDFIAFLCLKKIKSMRKIVLHTQGSIAQYVLEAYKGNYHKEDLHLPDSHSIFQKM